MPDVPPIDKVPDPALAGVPTNDRPPIGIPDPTPNDPDRERFVGDGATHIVLADRLGNYERGDKIGIGDLPKGADLARLEKLKPYPAIRPLTADESKGVPKAKAKLTDPPK